MTFQPRWKLVTNLGIVNPATLHTIAAVGSTVPVSIIRRRADLPPSLPGQPGPFSLGAEGALEKAFKDAGFTLQELEVRLRVALQEERGNPENHAGVANGMVALTRANYEIHFDPDKPPG